MFMNVLIAAESESADSMIPLFFSLYGLCYFIPFVALYVIIAFSVSLIRRGVYGAKHESATLFGFLLGVLGIISPPFLMLFSFMLYNVFDKFYIILPLFAHLMPSMVVLGLYMFVKDIGGKKFAMPGMISYMVFTGLLVTMVSATLLFAEDITLETGKMLSALGALFAIGLVAALIIMLIGFIQSFRWVKNHKPLIDEQQKQQLQMQQHQILMQQRQLEMQFQQLEMQKVTVNMLGDVHHELIEDNTQMIPPNSTGQNNQPGPGYGSGQTQQWNPPPTAGQGGRPPDQSGPGPGYNQRPSGQWNPPPTAGYGEKPPDQWG